MDNKYNSIEATHDQRRIWTLEGKLNRAEKSARKHKSDAANWQRLCHKAEAKLADVGQQAYDRGYARGLGVGLMIGSVATIIDMMFWRKLLK